jgi:hypothetical protein
MDRDGRGGRPFVPSNEAGCRRRAARSRLARAIRATSPEPSRPLICNDKAPLWRRARSGAPWLPAPRTGLQPRICRHPVHRGTIAPHPVATRLCARNTAPNALPLGGSLSRQAYLSLAASLWSSPSSAQESTLSVGGPDILNVPGSLGFAHSRNCRVPLPIGIASTQAALTMNTARARQTLAGFHAHCRRQPTGVEDRRQVGPRAQLDHAIGICRRAPDRCRVLNARVCDRGDSRRLTSCRSGQYA